MNDFLLDQNPKIRTGIFHLTNRAVDIIDEAMDLAISHGCDEDFEPFITAFVVIVLNIFALPTRTTSTTRYMPTFTLAEL